MQIYRSPLELLVGLMVAVLVPLHGGGQEGSYCWAQGTISKEQDGQLAVAGEQLFQTTELVPIHIEFTAKQFAALTPAAPGFGAPGFGAPGFGAGPRRGGEVLPAGENAHRNTFGTELPWSRAQVTVNGQKLSDVGVRYKGNYTYLATLRALKKSFKVDLDKFNPRQKYDGISKFNLHGGVSDPSKVREAFSYEFFRDVGVPAPRTTFAEVRLTVTDKYDQELVGLYTLTEQVNKSFLKRHFGDGSGLLLKPEGLHGGPEFLGENWSSYEQRWHPDNTPTEAQKKRLIDFTRLISQSSDEVFQVEIGTYLDIDAFLRFIAANTVLSNLDSYLGYGHNYYLYLVPSSNRFVFIPWDLDLSLATWPAAGTPEQLVNLSIEHPHAGPNRLLDRLFAIPAHRERFRQIIRGWLEDVFTSPRLLEKLARLERVVREPLVAEKKAAEARGVQAGIGGGGSGRPGAPGGRGFGGPGFGGPSFGGPGFGGASGEFGQSMSPRRFIELRIRSLEDQFAGRSRGFEPQPVADTRRAK